MLINPVKVVSDAKALSAKLPKRSNRGSGSDAQSDAKEQEARRVEMIHFPLVAPPSTRDPAVAFFSH